MTEDNKQDDPEKGARQRVEEGIRSGIGVLSAFKDALEETIRDARDRGDLSTERAKEVMKDALDKAQTAASGARERLDFVNHSEFEVLREAVEALAERVAALEAKIFDGGGQSAAEEESGEG
jgi:polyhydroxyalkanoate synthesis regulator phasin